MQVEGTEHASSDACLFAWLVGWLVGEITIPNDSHASLTNMNIIKPNWKAPLITANMVDFYNQPYHIIHHCIILHRRERKEGGRKWQLLDGGIVH